MMEDETEWVVALRMPPHNTGGLSLHQCPRCFALVVEDFMPEHLDWHAEPDRCTSRSEDGRRCHGNPIHPGTHWAAASRVWSDTETLVRPS